MQLSRDPGDKLLFIPRITLESDKGPRMQIPETAIMPMAPVPPSHLHRKGSSFQGGTATTGACSGNCRSPMQKPGKACLYEAGVPHRQIYPRDAYLQFPGSLMVFPALPADECFKHQSSPYSGYSFSLWMEGFVATSFLNGLGSSGRSRNLN
jgi:hypothetical protein